MGKHGGARKGAGRKKGIGVAHTIRRHVEEMVVKLLQDEAVRDKCIKETQGLLFQPQDEYVYIIEQDGHYKIGYTANISRRLNHYRVHAPKTRLVYLYVGEDAFELEQELHSAYSGFRKSGEWFDLPLDLLVDIISTCSSRLVN